MRSILQRLRSLVDTVRLIFSTTGARVIVAVSLLSIAGIWIGVGYLTSVDAKRTEDSAIQDTANLARAFEEHIIRLIQAYDQILLFGRSSFARGIGEFDLMQWAQDQEFANDVSLQIAIADKTGILTASNLPL